MSLVLRNQNSYAFNDGSMGQGYSRYQDTRSHKGGFPPMSNYHDNGWSSGPKHHSDPYQEKPPWSTDVGFRDHGGYSGSFYPGRAAGQSRYDRDTGAWHQHQTPGLSSGSGLGSGSLCPRCRGPLYGQGDDWGSNARDPYAQAQRRCLDCGFVQTTAPYSQPGGTGPLDDPYDGKPVGSFSGHHSRADWQPDDGGFETTPFNNGMPFPQSNSPLGAYDHHREQGNWNQGPFPSSGAHDFQDPYPMMDGDGFDHGPGTQGFPVGGGHSYGGYPGMGMSGTSRRGVHTHHPGRNVVTSYKYTESVYVMGGPGGMGPSPHGFEYERNRARW